MKQKTKYVFCHHLELLLLETDYLPPFSSIEALETQMVFLSCLWAWKSIVLNLTRFHLHV